MKRATVFFKSNRTAGQSDDVGGCQCRHKQAVPNTMQFVVRGDWICIFGVSTFKGLLSIPCDGRGARRPQGQSFRESVGPANVKLWGGTPHTMASQSRKVRRERHMRREPATISSCNGRQSSNSSNSQRILPKAIPQTNILFRRC